MEHTQSEFRFLFVLFFLWSVGFMFASYLLWRACKQMEDANEKTTTKNLFSWNKDELSNIRAISGILGVLAGVGFLAMAGYSLRRKYSTNFSGDSSSLSSSSSSS